MELTLIWYGESKKVQVEEGQTLSAAIEATGLSIEGWCGGEGLCEDCSVCLVSGQVQINQEYYSENDEDNILTCQAFITDNDVILEYPEKDHLKKEDLRKQKIFQQNTKILNDVKNSSYKFLNKPVKKELVLYHPDYWFLNSEWAKNLLLFSDGICLLIPKEKQLSIVNSNNYLLEDLKDNGLIHIFDAEEVVSKIITDKLRDAIELLLKAGYFEYINHGKTSLIHTSRIGLHTNNESAKWIYSELKRRRLIEKSDHHNMYRIRDDLYAFIVSFLAHLISVREIYKDTLIFPVSDRPGLVPDMEYLINGFRNNNRNMSDVMIFDFQTVGIDLSLMRTKDILKYRKEHHELYMNYVRTVRRFLREIHNLPNEEKAQAFIDRETDITNLSNELRSISRRSWVKPANFAFTIAGAAISLATSDPLPAAAMSTAAAISSLFDKSNSSQVELYSYLFNLPRNKELRY